MSIFDMGGGGKKILNFEKKNQQEKVYSASTAASIERTVKFC